MFNWIRNWWKPKEGNIRCSYNDNIEVFIDREWVLLEILIDSYKDYNEPVPQIVIKLLRGCIITNEERNEIIELCNWGAKDQKING